MPGPVSDREATMAAPPPPAPSPSPDGAKFRPQRYGRYILVDRLGAGGMAEVFRAVAIGAERFQRVVVVKRILPHLTENPSFTRMFIDEATLCGRLSHPNIIQVHEFGKQDSTYFIAMEYVEGRNIAHMLTGLSRSGGHIPVNFAAEVLRQACLGLGHAHALTGADGKPLGIVHRDVTPSNVMIAYTGGAVKLLDFGIARVEDEARVSTTDAGQVKGKSSYLAPEQVHGGRIDSRADIFAAGIVLHEALTGRRLFKGTNPLQTMKLIDSMVIPAPSKHNSLVPPRLDEIVMKALERRLDRRYQTAGEMAEALEGFLIEQRFSSQELPRTMKTLFADEMEKSRLVLPEKEINALMAEPVSSPPVKTPPPLTMTLESSDAIPISDSGVPLTFGGWTSVAQAFAARNRRRLAIAGAAAAGVGALLALLFAGGEPTAPKQTGPAETAPASKPVAPAAQPASATSPPRPAPLPATVAISFSSQPADAQVFRGDEVQAVGRTPLTVTLARGSATLAFRITKDGYVPGLLQVVPDMDKPVLVTLAKVSQGGEGRPRSKRSAGKAGKVKNAVPIDPFAP